jgi:hypothetical protein
MAAVAALLDGSAESETLIADPGGRASIQGFAIEKQQTYDLCWAAIAVSAARFHNIPNAPTQIGLVEEYGTSNQVSCPCSAHPGDNGLMLWCVDCAFQLLGLPYFSYTAKPLFPSVVRAMERQTPICVLRHFATYDHYVVIVGAHVDVVGQQMVTVADPDPSEPDIRDILHSDLMSGDGFGIAWYQF